MPFSARALKKKNIFFIDVVVKKNQIDCCQNVTLSQNAVDSRRVSLIRVQTTLDHIRFVIYPADSHRVPTQAASLVVCSIKKKCVGEY